MAEPDTPSLWQWIPAVTSIAGAGLSLYGGQTAAAGSEAAGGQARDASSRAARAYRDVGVRQAENDLIKASRVKAAKEFEAAQYEINAGQAIAAGQRTAIEERRQASLVSSRAIAIAAASGAGASDPSISNIVGRIRGEGAYRAANALYAGEDRARVLRLQAAAKKYEGLTAEEAGGLNAADALLSNEAKAVAEEAKGEAAYAAGKVGASAARTRGLAGALPGIAAGAGLLEKYWGKKKDDPKLEDVPVEGAEEISEDDIMASLSADATAVEADSAAWNELEYYDTLSATGGTDYGALMDVTDLSAATDWDWLAALSFS